MTFKYDFDLNSDVAPARLLRMAKPGSKVLDVGTGLDSITRICGGRSIVYIVKKYGGHPAGRVAAKQKPRYLLKYASKTIAIDIKAAKYYGSLTSKVRVHRNWSLFVMFKNNFLAQTITGQAKLCQQVNLQFCVEQKLCRDGMTVLDESEGLVRGARTGRLGHCDCAKRSTANCVAPMQAPCAA